MAAGALTLASHKELQCRRVFPDLAPLDIIRNPRHAVVSAIAMQLYRAAVRETVRDRLETQPQEIFLAAHRTRSGNSNK
jgi:hypothetical protein